MLFSSSNSVCASVFASSVLPTPVGPKEQEGSDRLRRIFDTRFGTDDRIGHFRYRFVLSDHTFVKDIFQPQDLCLFSLSVNFATGIPVHLEMILAISSSVTLSCTRERSSFFTFSSSISSCFCSFGSSPYCNSAALFRSYCCCAAWIWRFRSSICSRSVESFSTECFSFSHCAFCTENASL